MGNYTCRNFGKAEKNLHSEPFRLPSMGSSLMFLGVVPRTGTLSHFVLWGDILSPPRVYR